MDLNLVTLVGRLAEDVDYTAGIGEKSSRAVARLIVNRPPGKTGSSRYDAIQIVAWGAYADSMAQYTAKGKELAITGELRVNSIAPKKQGGSWTNYTEVQIKHVSYGNDSNQGKAMKLLQGVQDTLDVATQAKSTEKDIAALVAHPNIKSILQNVIAQGTTADKVLVQDNNIECTSETLIETPFG